MGDDHLQPFCFKRCIHARAAVADMWLVFFVTAAFWAAVRLMADWLSPSVVVDPERLSTWRLTFYIALAFAFLAKGPLGWMPLVTAGCMKFFLRGRPLNQRFWFASGCSSRGHRAGLGRAGPDPDKR